MNVTQQYKYKCIYDKQMSINLRDIKRGFFVPFLQGMRSSTTIITNFFLIGSKIRTLYKPRGLYSLVTNIRRIESGNSLAQAKAATSQQSPTAPWHKSLGSISPSNNCGRLPLKAFSSCARTIDDTYWFFTDVGYELTQ